MYVLCMEVDEDGQLAVDDSLGEVFVVLHVKRHAPGGGQREAVWERPREERLRCVQTGREGRGARDDAGRQTLQISDRNTTNPPDQEPESHLTPQRDRPLLLNIIIILDNSDKIRSMLILINFLILVV